MSTPIERISGYACEVNEDQWRELVKVADEVGLLVGEYSRNNGTDKRYRVACVQGNYLILGNKILNNESVTPYPDFLAKLKGEEKWEPKNGDEVECRDGLGADWFLAMFVGYDGKWAVCRPQHHPLGHYTTHNDVNIRPLRPAITRAEAEQMLGKRIVD